MNVLRHWPERIVAVTDGEHEPAALIEYRRLEPGEQAEPSDVEYIRGDLHRGAVEALDALRRAADAFDATLSSTVDGPKRDAMRVASLAALRRGGSSR